MPATAQPPRRRYLKSNRSERMIARFEVKAIDEQARTFTGALSSSHLDLGNGFMKDIVWPGAFKRWIKSFASATDPYVPLLDSHSPFSVMNVYGHMLDAAERLTGTTLSYALKTGKSLEVPEMFLDTTWQVIDGPDGDRIFARLRPGSVRKMSMGYESIKADFDTLDTGDTVRNLREVRVEEGSLVVFAMQPMAEVDPGTVKLLLDKKDLTEDDLAYLADVYENIGKLMQTAPEPEPAEADAERLLKLRDRLAGVTQHRLATRIGAIRHAAERV